MWATPLSSPHLYPAQFPVVVAPTVGAARMNTNAGQVVLVCQPIKCFCPVTGGSHDIRRQQGVVSIALSVATFPLGLIA